MLVDVKNVAFSYNQSNDVLKDINFQVKKGQVLCLVGPNGCGKTTLLDCMLGIRKNNSGEVLLNGNNIKTLKPFQIAQQIAYVPQSHEAAFPYKVIDMVLMGRAAYTNIFSSPKEKDIEIAENALDMVGMKKFRDRIYTQLSGGEAQMVMIARALAQDTPIIIMDEPTSHLDFKHELTILEIIVDLVKKKDLTIIMATHFLNQAFYFENNKINTLVAMIQNGKIGAYGAASEVISNENISNIYDINAKVVLYDNDLSYIVPISTKKEVLECQSIETN